MKIVTFHYILRLLTTKIFKRGKTMRYSIIIVNQVCAALPTTIWMTFFASLECRDEKNEVLLQVF